jgi:hypothetical protein
MNTIPQNIMKKSLILSLFLITVTTQKISANIKLPEVTGINQAYECFDLLIKEFLKKERVAKDTERILAKVDEKEKELGRLERYKNLPRDEVRFYAAQGIEKVFRQNQHEDALLFNLSVMSFPKNFPPAAFIEELGHIGTRYLRLAKNKYKSNRIGNAATYYSLSLHCNLLMANAAAGACKNATIIKVMHYACFGSKTLCQFEGMECEKSKISQEDLYL